MESLTFTATKGVLAMDSNGDLTLSIPASASVQGYSHSDGLISLQENKSTFPYAGSHGILTFRMDSQRHSLVITASRGPETKGDQKTYRFPLEANSVVPASVTPKKAQNITEVSLTLNTGSTQEYSMPVYNTRPAPVAPSAADKGCCDVQVQNIDTRRGTSQTTVISQSQKGMNSAMEQKIKEATERMLQTPIRRNLTPMTAVTPAVAGAAPASLGLSVPAPQTRAPAPSAPVAAPIPTPATPPALAQTLQTLQSLQGLAAAFAPQGSEASQAFSQLQGALNQASAPVAPTPAPRPVQQPQRAAPQPSRAVASAAPVPNMGAFASIPGMAKAMSNPQNFAPGQNFSDADLMRMADEAISKAKAAVAR